MSEVNALHFMEIAVNVLRRHGAHETMSKITVLISNIYSTFFFQFSVSQIATLSLLRIR